MKQKMKFFTLILFILLTISFCINIIGINRNIQRKQLLINRIFFNVEFSIIYLERYLEEPANLFNLNYAGIQLVELNNVLQTTKELHTYSVPSFNTLIDNLVVLETPPSNELLEELLVLLHELSAELASPSNPNMENKKLTYSQIDNALYNFFTDYEALPNILRY